MRAGEPCNGEGAPGETRLIGKGIVRREHILLEARIDRRRVGQLAFQQRRGDRNHNEPVRLDNRPGARQLVIGEIDDVLAEDHAQFRPAHAELRHRAHGGFRSGENSSVIAAMGKRCVMKLVFYRACAMASATEYHEVSFPVLKRFQKEQAVV